MGKFINKFKGIMNKIDEKANQDYKSNTKQRSINKHLKQKTPESISAEMFEGIDEGFDNPYDLEDPYANTDEINLNDLDKYGVGIQPAQKPESFHHFILENQYKDLEKSIRGYKDVYNKETREWETKRKESHCFTDEEAEEILRMAQTLLATDIKLSFINK
jgi:hypothetical protein